MQLSHDPHPFTIPADMEAVGTPLASQEKDKQAQRAIAPDLEVDRDGILIPPKWVNRKNWEAQPIPWRQKRIADYLAALAIELSAKPKENRTGMGASTFTTKYAIEWGKAQCLGRIHDREWWDGKRSHDAPLGMDVIFEDRETYQLTGIQGAGKGERAAHRQRFEERGGVARAKGRNMRIFYVEFVRGNKTPILVEQWA